MKNFEAVIFDMDGLLLDSERMAFNAFLKTCRQFNLSDRSDLVYQCIGTNAETTKKIVLDAIGSEVDFDIFWKSFHSTYQEDITTNGIPMKQGVVSLLDHISSLDVPMAVATSTETDIAETKLANAGIIKYFENITGGEQVNRSKPAPDIYLKAASSLNVNTQYSLALEDSENGVMSANAAGLTVIQIPDLVQPSDELKQNGHIILHSLKDVINYNFT